MSTGILALLDLPVGTSLSIDGKAIVLKRDDFVGFDAIPSQGFHLATIQAPSSNSQAPRHGFILQSHTNTSNDWIVAHRYDPLTEEVSFNPIDETSASNLETTIRQNGMEPPRVIPCTRLHSDAERDEWQRATRFIDTDLLRIRKVYHGNKIVPGAYEENGELQSQTNHVDGRPLDYPPIPVLGKSPLRCRHAGTKRYLSTLSPSQRTSLVMEGPSAALRSVIETCYHNDWRALLGDVQLAHLLFLNLHCLSSLEHWRDLIAMLSLPETIDETHTQLYSNLATILQLQMKYMDREFFEDMEFSEDNFFLPAILRLTETLQACRDETLKQKAAELRKAASKLFPASNDDVDQEELTKHTQLHTDKKSRTEPMDDEDSDGPVVVSVEDYEASMALSTIVSSKMDYPLDHRTRYPLLFAAMQPHEDILMVCARALDTQTDVSLVREAAKYLEEVEARKS